MKELFSKIKAAKPNVKFYPEFDPENMGDIRALTIEGEELLGKRTKLFGYYGLPKSSGKKVPAVVLVHGGGGHAFCCWVKQWNDRGYAAIALDYTGFMPNTRNAGYREHFDDNVLWERKLISPFSEEGFVPSPDNDYMNIDAKPLYEQWIYHAVSAAIKANTFMRGEEQIDQNKIGIVGISWGGVVTSLTIGFDNRFAFAVPIYGSGYLKDGLGTICPSFKRGESEKWRAENNFCEVEMPVLWLAWNDDSPFSVQSNSLSYYHTVKNNAQTRIAIVNEMNHSHACGWCREEPLLFADSVCKGAPQMPRLLEEGKGDNVLIKCDGTTLKSATLYYITSPMEYEEREKYGNKMSFMKQDWSTLPLCCEDGLISGTLPTDASGYYIEVIFTCGEKECVVTTGYKGK